MNQRLTEVYNRLVDETENPATLHNERKNHLLHKLSELVEYIMEFEHTNPLDEWFNDDEPNAVAPNELFEKLAN